MMIQSLRFNGIKKKYSGHGGPEKFKSGDHMSQTKKLNQSVESGQLGLLSTIGLNFLMVSYLISIVNLSLDHVNRKIDAAKICSSYNMSLKTVQKIGNEYKIDCFFKK